MLELLFSNRLPTVGYANEQWDEVSFDLQMAVNLKGPYFLIQSLLPILTNPASIVLNTSINAHIGMPNSTVYSASKAAMISLAKTLSGELIDYLR